MSTRGGFLQAEPPKAGRGGGTIKAQESRPPVGHFPRQFRPLLICAVLPEFSPLVTLSMLSVLIVYGSVNTNSTLLDSKH